MRRLLTIALIGLVALSGCGGSDDRPPAAGKADIGLSETHLETRYEFESYPGSPWYGPDSGERILSTDVINVQTGPDHCGWEDGVLLNVAWPLGEEAETVSETRQYLHDPEGVFETEWMRGDYQGDADVPATAKYTGYRTDFMELWLVPEEDEAAYLVFADHVELWPRAVEPLVCD